MFRGRLVALVTPMTESGDVDHVAFGRLLDWHAREGSDGVVVGGTTGESATLNAAESAELLQIAVQRLGGRLPVIAGTGGASTAQSVERTRTACELGADGVLVVTPYYNRPPQEGLYRHFSVIADASSVPLILYNVPSRTACDLLPETVERLSGHPQIIGIKDATGSIARGKEILERCGDDFLLLSGDVPSCRELIAAGAQGVIAVTGNVAPRLMHEMVEAALLDDQAGARNSTSAFRVFTLRSSSSRTRFRQVGARAARADRRGYPVAARRPVGRATCNRARGDAPRRSDRMRIGLIRLACVAIVLPLAGCSVLPDAYTGCNDPKPYEAAVQKDPCAFRRRRSAGYSKRAQDSGDEGPGPAVGSGQLPRSPAHDRNIRRGKHGRRLGASHDRRRDDCSPARVRHGDG
jgi:4-hydroxy-tetrahydrodipicolinate synthase